MSSAPSGPTRLVYSMFPIQPTDLISTSVDKIIANLFEVRLGRFTRAVVSTKRKKKTILGHPEFRVLTVSLQNSKVLSEFYACLEILRDSKNSVGCLVVEFPKVDHIKQWACMFLTVRKFMVRLTIISYY